jgi:hypothetical protein
VASYDGATLKVTEFFVKDHSTVNVYLWRLRVCVFHFIHLSVTGEAEIAKSTHLKVTPHTLYVQKYLINGRLNHNDRIKMTITS